MPNSSATAKPTRPPTLREAIKFFKNSLSDDQLVQGGQFIWKKHYFKELLNVAEPLIDGDSILQAAWRDGTTSLFDRMRDAMEAGNEILVSTLINNEALPASSKTQSKASQALRPLLVKNGEGGRVVYDGATELLRKGKPVRPFVDDTYEATFRKSRLSFRGAARIKFLANTQCFNMVNAVCDYIRENGGLALPVAPEVAGIVDLKQVFEQRVFTRLGIRRFNAPLFDLVAYGTNLEQAVTNATQQLDFGKTICAQVVPGGTLDNPSIISPEHSIALIAHERREERFPRTIFCFWDPDPVGTSHPFLEPNFGLIFFEDGKTAQDRVREGPHVGLNAANGAAATYGPAFYANGRFTTALFDVDLNIVGARGEDRLNQHRYQITAMTAR